jgi:hypothetical protein
MRKSLDSLHALVREHLELDAFAVPGRYGNSEQGPQILLGAVSGVIPTGVTFAGVLCTGATVSGLLSAAFRATFRLRVSFAFFAASLRFLAAALAFRVAAAFSAASVRFFAAALAFLVAAA